ncbi:MAG: AraC family transcriptional regulator ligand-binding domain-containing protein [Proteobacteria bacterium]|nr:AraC family transcriptional regulator ligand-binding domain-containing protein [Pseudomonadota bacterium]
MAKGGQLSVIFASAGLASDTLVEENVLIPFDKFIYLLEAAEKQLNFANLSLQLARQQDILVLAPLGPMLNKCKDLSAALDTIVKYLQILFTGCRIDIGRKNGTIKLSYETDLVHIEQQPQYQDYALAGAVNILHQLVGQAFPLRACYFTRSETDSLRIAEYSNYFRCPVAFSSQSLAIVVDEKVLSLKVHDIVSRLSARINTSLSLYPSTIVEQVSRVINYSLPGGCINIDDIAASMGYSPRTLQRRLKSSGTSFSLLVDAVRLKMADQYLKNSFYRITDIALMLGYSNHSSFSRSYYRCCGYYPIDVRKGLSQVSIL